MKNIGVGIIFCLLNLGASVTTDDNATVNYYVNLITQETARANTYQLPTDSSSFKPISSKPSVYGIYHYIIVGAGSAGAVIANRLSEIKENKILLLEAGGHESNFSDIPKMNNYLRGLQFNWNYNTTPQTNSCLNMLNQECSYPRGKGLGGSSIINGLLYVRGNKQDYNRWCKQGNPGWCYKDVLPFFKKSENFQINGDQYYHGIGGNLNVETYQPESPQFKAFLEANRELGRKVVDYNGREQLGVGKTQLNTINGRRDSTGKAFLKPAMNRPNLEILTHSLVIKILINTISKVAYGVLFSHKGQLLIAKARKEVILSAGSIGSPQLLMLSGIGLRRHLRNLKIPVLKPLAVGNNLQDHAFYNALQFVTNYTEPVKTLKENVKEYLNDYGPLTIPMNFQGIGFFQTRLAKFPGVPDIELLIIPSSGATESFERPFQYKDITNIATNKVNESNNFKFFVILLHPKSRGEVRLKSKDPYDYPLINPNFLSDPKGEDIEVMYQGIQLALEIANTKAFKKLNANLVYAPLPVCQENKYLSRNYWYCQLRQSTVTEYHPIGTAKMGPDPNNGAVVNHELKVHGIKNLRVADASVIPEIISGHTNAPSIMIGEKVSQMIKEG